MNKFWNNKKVLVTGHTGFVGSWLSLWLHLLGAEVTGLALEPITTPNFFSLLSLEQQIDSVMGDIRDYGVVTDICNQTQPDIIFHLAAQPLVRYSYNHPLETYQTNVLGTVNLLEYFRLSKHSKTFINVTTDKCYVNKEWIWSYRENERLGGHDPYSNSKACSELITASYRKSFFDSQGHKGLATARAGNIIGGGDWSEDRLIPDFIRAAMSNMQMTIRNPQATRPWLYMLDPIWGYLQLAEKLWDKPQEYSSAWNFGPNENGAQTVEYVVSKLCDFWPTSMAWKRDTADHLHEASFLQLDHSKAKQYLDWSPRSKIEGTLKRTINWYVAFMNKENLYDYSVNEINNYLKSQGKEGLLSKRCLRL